MNEQNVLSFLDENEIEELLGKIQPIPSRNFHKRMERAYWRRRQRQTIAFANKSYLKLAVAVTVLLAITVLTITPQGRAFAQSILKFFIRADSDMIPVPTQPITWVEVTPGVSHPTTTPQSTPTPSVAFADDCGNLPDMLCSVEQIRSKVDFAIKEIANIPTGMYFTGATGGPDRIFLRYEYENNSGGLFITEERWTGLSVSTWPEIGASAVVEDIQIGNLAGEYFRGSFVQNASAGDEIAKWDPNFNLETLRWVEDDIAYTLQYSFTTQSPLGKDGLVEIAKSMTTELVTKFPMPATATPFPTAVTSPNRMELEIALVERQAGFELNLPSRLPEGLSSQGGASYNRATGVASVWITYDTVYMNGLYVNQQIVSNPDDCSLCDVVVGNSNSALLTQGPEVVGADANLQTVKIGNLMGKYYEGTRLGSGEWEVYPDIKHLRWQENGRAFEIISLGTGLSLEDLIIIAESMK